MSNHRPFPARSVGGRPLGQQRNGEAELAGEVVDCRTKARLYRAPRPPAPADVCPEARLRGSSLRTCAALPVAEAQKAIRSYPALTHGAPHRRGERRAQPTTRRRSRTRCVAVMPGRLAVVHHHSAQAREGTLARSSKSGGPSLQRAGIRGLVGSALRRASARVPNERSTRGGRRFRRGRGREQSYGMYIGPSWAETPLLRRWRHADEILIISRHARLRDFGDDPKRPTSERPRAKTVRQRGGASSRFDEAGVRKIGL